MPRRETSRLEFLGQLAGGLAHEIKNPLSTMRLTLQLLQEDMAADKSALAMRSARKIELLLKEVAHLDEVVQEFLRLSRGHDLKLARTDLVELVNELFEFLVDDADRRNVALRTEFHGDLSGLVLDRGYIRQALMNLLRNALDAIELVGSGEILVRAQLHDDVAVIEVIDTGCGIAESNLHRMFRPYFTTKKGGTGMGLAMVRRIVEEHGGQVTFESVEGRGSRFVMLLPADPGKKSALKSIVLATPREVWAPPEDDEPARQA